MDSESCRRAVSPAGTPQDEEDCRRWLAMLQMMRNFYIWKFIPPPPRPDPTPFADVGRLDINRFLGDPDPEPMMRMFGDLFLDRLRQGPTSTASIFNEIRKSGAQVTMVRELAAKFEEGSKFLRAELEALEKSCQEEKK